ncbi:hypothetical protein ACFU7Z_31075 [Kitasatospora sp. NPDC057518]|uniref:hypothetical protein n=1 Tax=unclassified Kitasatospora TaxID=2633591 RepID=UPI003696A9A8
MRRSVPCLVSSAPLVLALSLLGAPVPAQAAPAPRASAGPAAAAPTRATGTFAVPGQDCGPWGCQYAPPHFLPEDPPAPCGAFTWG